MDKVILTPNPYRDKEFKTLREAMCILKENNIETRVCLPFMVDKNCVLPKDIYFSRLDRELPGASMVICFGGDGTILHMSKAATRNNVPVLGVNIGTMGFMAELESSEISLLSRIATGEYSVVNRMMLDVVVHRDRDIIFHDICLNDVVITKGAVARIVHLAVKCDGVQAMECGGDGIIVATPTGSTAYSMSAGGPIVEPNAENLILTPICAHSLNPRTVVLRGSRKVEIKLGSKVDTVLSLDGNTTFHVFPDDIIEITKSRYITTLVVGTKRNFYEIVKRKLNTDF